MDTVALGQIVIDVCLSCRSAWFDEGELAEAVSRHAADIRARVQSFVARPARGAFLAPPASGGGPTHGIGNALEVVEAGLSVPGAIVSVGEAAVTAGEAAVTVVEGVFGVLDGVLGIFDGL